MPAPLRALLAGATLLAGSLAGMLLAAPVASATALPIGQCTTSYGVVLAVDFSHWSGPLERACGSTPTSGYQLLNQGGWHSTGTARYQGFICRIGYSGFRSGTGYPTPDEDPCQATPPASASWSYWHADPDDTGWTLSGTGAAEYSPKPGSVDLWTFGNGSAPGYSPNSVRAQNSAPVGGVSSTPAAPRSSAPPASTPAAPAGSSTGPPVAEGPQGRGASAGPSSSAGSGSDSPMARATAHAGRSTSTASASSASASIAAGTSSGSSSGAVPPVVDAQPRAPAPHSTGSFLPALVAGLLVVALGGGAAYFGWHRRQAG